LGTALSDSRRKVRANFIGHTELLVRPAIDCLGQRDLVFTQWRAVRTMRVRLVRRTERDRASDDDQRRLVGRVVELLDRRTQRLDVVGITNLHDVPTEPFKPLADVFRKCEFGIALDRDVIIVVQPAEVGQLQMSGDGCRFAADAFHQIAVAAHGVHVVVEQVKALLVVASGKPLRRHRHADAVANALPQRARRCFDARRVAVFGMARTRTSQLSKTLDVVERDAQFASRLLDAREMQNRVQQDRHMSTREDEPVAGWPIGMFGIVSERVVPQSVCDGSQRHRGSRVAAVCLLDRVHRQGADRVNGQLLSADGGCGHGVTPQ
jgi:hypothetical protein